VLHKKVMSFLLKYFSVELLSHSWGICLLGQFRHITTTPSCSAFSGGRCELYEGADICLFPLLQIYS